MNLLATANPRFRLDGQGKRHGFAWRRWMGLSLGFLGVCGAPAARADNSKILPPLLQGIGIDQRLNEQVPLDLQFRDEAGKTATLGDYFGKKPVILSLVYFACPMLCTMAENGLLHSLQEVKFGVGDQFEVLTVSFDPHDNPELAAAKKGVYVGLYGRKRAGRSWHFLTGDEASIQQLTRAVGFRIMAWRGKFSPQRYNTVEMSGLY